MKFRSAYTEHKHYFSPTGGRFRKTYVRQVNKDGTSKLVESGTEDVYDSIQKAGVGLAIDDLIRRAKAGDNSAIPPVVDSYPDLTKAPKDLLEAHQLLLDARAQYNSLSSELRSKFNNNFDEFLKASSDGSAFKAAVELAKPKTPSPTLTADEINALKAQLKSGGNSNA